MAAEDPQHRLLNGNEKVRKKNRTYTHLPHGIVQRIAARRAASLVSRTNHNFELHDTKYLRCLKSHTSIEPLYSSPWSLTLIIARLLD
jgi:hypothetical protein